MSPIYTLSSHPAPNILDIQPVENVQVRWRIYVLPERDGIIADNLGITGVSNVYHENT